MTYEPLKLEEKFSEENERFLKLILGLIKEKKIDLYKPGTLINESVYKNLTDEEKAKADFEAVNMIGSIREIYNLVEAGYERTYQTENLVERLRNQKERLEEVSGDIFII
jgi:hypothetical protein